MYPYFVLFGRQIGTYTLAALCGIFAAGIFACKTAKKSGLDENDMLILLLISAIGVLIGGHVLYGVTNADKIAYVIRNFSRVTSLKIFAQVLYAIFGGSVFYGGLIGGLIAGAIYLRRSKMDSGTAVDIAACAIPLMHGFGRIGCFLGGCCYGVECEFGFTFRHAPLELANGVRRFPVQLAEALLNFLLFFLLLALFKKGRARRRLLNIYLIIYPVLRFLLEFLRGDEYRGFLLGFSTSQIISAGLILFSVVSLWARRKRERAAADT